MKFVVYLKALETVSLTLLIVGGINWGLVGLFQVDLVASIFGGAYTAMSRFVYGLIGAAAILEIIILSSSRSEIVDSSRVQAERKPRQIHTT